MSNINKDTVIQQCADGYRTASGTTEPVKYGELGAKIAELGGGGLDCTVTFMANGEPYNIQSVKSGERVVEPSINPISSEGYNFSGWVDSDNNDIVFPYTPTANIELSAKFTANRTEIEISTPTLVTNVGTGSITKSNNGLAIAGAWQYNGNVGVILVAKSREAAAFTSVGGYLGNVNNTDYSVEYNGEQYYICFVRDSNFGTSALSGGVPPYVLPNTHYFNATGIPEAATELLNYYHNVT